MSAFTTMALRWAPPAILGLGALLTVGIDLQREMPLRAPLHTAVPTEIRGFTGRDVAVSEAEQRVAGMDEYLLRIYAPTGAAEEATAFSVYVGYYKSQMQGRTIHSPKNCLPGSGWEALASTTAVIPTAEGDVRVNRYIIQNRTQRALVLYWYQGRGRVESNEYAVKWDLLRDAALHGRTEEALVRIVVPITTSEAEAYELAADVAATLVPAVSAALPAA